MNWYDFTFGALSGVSVFIVAGVFAGRKLMTNPPEAFIKSIARRTVRQAVKSSRHG